MRQSFEAKLEYRIERASRTQIHGIIPFHYFSVASSECRNMFLDDYFYGCISIAQAMAEAISRFICKVHNIRAAKALETRIARLEEKKLISSQAADAFRKIHGNDRNTFHHLNEDVETEYQLLQNRAEECVNALYLIESEVFGYDFSDGSIAPKRPEYWPLTGPNTGAVYLRLGQ